MQLEVTHGHRLTAEEAVAELEKLGLHPVVADVRATENEFHWHDFDSVFYILEGSLDVTDHASGETTTLVVGDRIQAPGGFGHREKHDGYKAVFGFSVEPAALVFPLEKPLPVPA
jgi:mannose-6-phosphate isomerase-like protein (cupin superfamily)